MCFDIEEIRISLEQEIKTLPKNFYDTFNYTKTGNNLTHPITLGILCEIFYNFNWVERIGIDVRLNLDKKQKFQPDIVVYSRPATLDKVTLFIDYESPNSSDARIPKKDINSYSKWIKHEKCQIPYVIITTLPNKQPDCWEVRYTSGEKACNKKFYNKKTEIRKNPFVFWYKYYKKCGCFENKDIYFLNIDGKKVRHIDEITRDSLLIK